MRFIQDMAIQDLDGVPIAESYLCTETSNRWKGPLAMIAMVLGNSAGVFGVAFAVMITIARWYDLKIRAGGNLLGHWMQGIFTNSCFERIEVSRETTEAPPADLESASGARNSMEKVCRDESSSSTQGPLLPILTSTAEPEIK